MRALSQLNTKELREIAAELGANKKRLYGTSKQALIIIINKQIGFEKGTGGKGHGIS